MNTSNTSNTNSADLAPLALSILGTGLPVMNPIQTRQHSTPPTLGQSRIQCERRTSYYHSFQTRCTPSTDSPPSYAVSAQTSRLPRFPRHLDNGNEILPKYTCTVAREGMMHMRIEKISPFQYLPKQQWRPVYVVLQGTQLSIHKLNTTTVRGIAVSAAGRLIRKYTLQHAEIGLATDVNDHILLPLTRLAQLIPTMARQKAFEKDSHLFKSVKQFVLRLRLETDQLLLSQSSEDTIFNWANSISAGIDISFPIDDRGLPRQSTLPRRRRRQQRPLQEFVDLLDRDLVEEQERILRDVYPSLARRPSQDDTSQQQQDTAVTALGAPCLTLTFTNVNEQDSEDIDLSALAEDGGSLQPSTSRPGLARHTTTATANTTLDTISRLQNLMELDEFGKWAPLHPYTPGQQWRYIRRCMPVLLFDAPRASSILMCRGRRLRINARMDMLEEWSLQPPSYDAHSFPTITTAATRDALERTSTYISAMDATSLARSSDDDMDIQTVPTSDTAIVSPKKAQAPKGRKEMQQAPSVLNVTTTPPQQLSRNQPHKTEDGLLLEQRYPVLMAF